jgi:DNA replication protein DnaC
MLIQPTLDKLHEMRLIGMAEALQVQLEQPDYAGLSFEERFGLLVDQEWTYRQNRSLARRLKEAKLRLSASVEEIDYRQSRELDRSVLLSLANCDWVRSHQVVLITGPTGSGKTFIGCALAQAACRQGFSARYYRVSRLLQELALARGDGSYPRFLQRLAKVDVLFLDDWGLAPLSPAESRELLEVIDDRTQTRATVIASQLPVAEWHGMIGDPTVADAILDRLVHRAHKVTLKGESMRKVASAESR